MKTSIKFRWASLLFCLLLSACNLPGSVGTSVPPASPSNAPTSETVAPATSSSAPSAPVEHRIGIRVVDGVGEFFDRQTGGKFVPRGNNYVRLDPQKRDDGSQQTYHSVFDPGLYDKPELTTAFQQMHELGYNTVRVFVSQNTIGTADDGLNEAYMQNVVDFLNLAKEYGLYVIFTQDWLPGGKYGQILSKDCCNTFTMMNVHFLSPAGLEANIAYFQDFARYLIAHNAPIEMVFSYELRNELFFDMDFPPLSMTSGNVTALDGKTYDMSSLEDKKRMIDSNLVLWMDKVRAAIQEVDPTALVSVGFFWPQEPNPARVGDARYINTAPAIWNSKLDFIDLHPYPGAELTFPQYVENFGINGMQEKPIIMGEFGAATEAVPSVSKAASMLVDWQVQSCNYGFDGWLLWTWDIYENNDFYSAKSDQGQIGQALAPVNRPDPCQAKSFDFIENNVALHKSVRVSRALSDQPGANAVDGTGAQWGAGASPTQWIQIDLGQMYTVKLIRLMVGQYPDGNTTHNVYVGNSADNLQLVHSFDGLTKDNQLLEFLPESPLTGVRYVRIVTTKSPSWVAWKEIEVIAP
jgi:hypothetical protein